MKPVTSLCRITVARWLIVSVVGWLWSPVHHGCAQAQTSSFSGTVTGAWVNPTGNADLVAQSSDGDTATFTHGKPLLYLGGFQITNPGPPSELTFTKSAFTGVTSLSPFLIGSMTLLNGTDMVSGAATGVTLRLSFAFDKGSSPTIADLPLRLTPAADNGDPRSSADTVSINGSPVVQGPDGQSYKLKFSWVNQDGAAAFWSATAPDTMWVFEGARAKVELWGSLIPMAPVLAAYEPEDVYSLTSYINLVSQNTLRVHLDPALAVDPSLRLQWYRVESDNTSTAVAGAGGPSFTPQLNGRYYVRVENAYGATVSRTATWEINPNPWIVTEPSDITGTVGDTVTLSIDATDVELSRGIAHGALDEWFPRHMVFTLYRGDSGDKSSLVQQSAYVGGFPIKLTTNERYWIGVQESVADNVIGDSVRSRTINVIVKGPPPLILQQPQDATIYSSQTASLTVAPSASPVTYQWYRGLSGNTATPVPDSNTATLLVSGTNAGIYWVRVINDSGSIDSRAVTVSVNSLLPPIIYRQPEDYLVSNGWLMGVGATWSTAPAAPPAGYFQTYQWYSGESGDTSSPITGATSENLLFNNIGTPAMWVRVTNNAGFADSRTARPARAPSITVQPADSVGDFGSTVDLAVVAIGATRYQWYLGQSGDTSSPVYRGIYSQLSTRRDSAESYWVRVSNAAGSVDSRTALAAITPLPVPTVSGPDDLVLVAGANNYLSVSALHARTTQWFKGRAGDTSSPIAGGTGPFLQLTMADAGQYWVRTTNESGTADSRTATVSNPPPSLPTITTQPQDVSLTIAVPASLTVTAQNAQTFQWYLGPTGDTSSPIQGATASSLQLTQTASGAYYAALVWVRVSNAGGSVDSRTVTVIADPFRLEPSGAPIASTALDLTVRRFESLGTGPFSFTWYRGGTLIRTGSSPVFSIDQITPSNAGIYSVRVSYGGNTVTTNSVRVDYAKAVNDTVTAVEGTRAQLSFVTSPGLTFQWLDLSGQPMQETAHTQGTRTATLVIDKATAADVGTYSCMISNGIDTVPWSVELKVVGKPILIWNSDTNWRLGYTPTASVVPDNEGSGLVITVTGLPPGVSFDPLSKTIVGAPTRIGTYTVKVQGRNVYGLGPAITQTIVVTGLESSFLGTFNGLLDPDDRINNGLGGRFTLKTTPNRTFTGTITYGAVSRSFTGTLQYSSPDPGAYLTSEVVLTTLRGVRTLWLSIQLNDDGHLYGTLWTNTSGTSFAGIRSPFINGIQAVNYAGIHIAALPINPIYAGDKQFPQGVGYVGGVISLSGVFTASARFADNTVATISATIGQNETMPLHWLLYSGTGSVQGWAKTDGTTMDGDLTWMKQAQPTKSTTRSYKSGFPAHSLQIKGGRMRSYEKNDIVLGWPQVANNATVSFEDLVSTGTVTKAASVLIPKDSPFVLSVNRDQNKFSGSVSVGGRAGACYGVFVDQLGLGVGFVNLPESTSKTAAILSERIAIEAVR